MRRNNFNDMTVVEQIITIKEDTCLYACKHMEQMRERYHDPQVQLIMLQEYCQRCPLGRLHIETL